MRKYKNIYYIGLIVLVVLLAYWFVAMQYKFKPITIEDLKNHKIINRDGWMIGAIIDLVLSFILSYGLFSFWRTVINKKGHLINANPSNIISWSIIWVVLGFFLFPALSFLLMEEMNKYVEWLYYVILGVSIFSTGWGLYLQINYLENLSRNDKSDNA